MFVAQGDGVPADAEWLSFRNALFVLMAITAATLINVKGPSRSIGYGAALYLLTSRIKIITSSLMTSVMEAEYVAVALWFVFLALLTGCFGLVALSAWRNRTTAPRTRAGAIAVSIMIGTAVGAAVYTFWAWSGTVNSVRDFATVCAGLAFTTGLSVFAIVLAYRFDRRFGLLGYIGIFLVVHGLFVLGVGMKLSANHDFWYELPLLAALVVAAGFALYAWYHSRVPVPERRAPHVDVIDLRSDRPVEAEFNSQAREVNSTP